MTGESDDLVDALRIISTARDGVIGQPATLARVGRARKYRAEMFKYSGGDPTVPCIDCMMRRIVREPVSENVRTRNSKPETEKTSPF